MKLYFLCDLLGLGLFLFEFAELVKLTFMKCHQRLVVNPGTNVETKDGLTESILSCPWSNPSLAWKKTDVFKMIGDH